MADNIPHTAHITQIPYLNSAYHQIKYLLSQSPHLFEIHEKYYKKIVWKSSQGYRAVSLVFFFLRGLYFKEFPSETSYSTFRHFFPNQESLHVSIHNGEDECTITAHLDIVEHKQGCCNRMTFEFLSSLLFYLKKECPTQNIFLASVKHIDYDMMSYVREELDSRYVTEITWTPPPPPVPPTVPPKKEALPLEETDSVSIPQVVDKKPKQKKKKKKTPKKPFKRKIKPAMNPFIEYLTGLEQEIQTQGLPPKKRNSERSQGIISSPKKFSEQEEEIQIPLLIRKEAEAKIHKACKDRIKQIKIENGEEANLLFVWRRMLYLYPQIVKNAEPRYEEIYQEEFDRYIDQQFREDYISVFGLGSPTSIRKKRHIPLQLPFLIAVDLAFISLFCYFLTLDPRQRYWLIMDNVWCISLIVLWSFFLFYVNYSFYLKKSRS